MEYKIIPSRINDIEPTEAEVKWENIVKKSKCKTCMHFKQRTLKKKSRCENPNRIKKVYFVNKENKACKDYDEVIEGYLVNTIYL